MVMLQYVGGSVSIAMLMSDVIGLVLSLKAVERVQSCRTHVRSDEF